MSKSAPCPSAPPIACSALPPSGFEIGQNRMSELCYLKGMNVQGWVADDPSGNEGEVYESVTCLACTRFRPTDHPARCWATTNRPRRLAERQECYARRHPVCDRARIGAQHGFVVVVAKMARHRARPHAIGAHVAQCHRVACAHGGEDTSLAGRSEQGGFD